MTDYHHNDEYGSADLTHEQIHEVWKRVLAGMEDPAEVFDPLMLYNESDTAAGNSAISAAEQIYQDEYDVYSDIENSVYGRTSERGGTNPAPAAQPEASSVPEPSAKPGRRLQREFAETFESRSSDGLRSGEIEGDLGSVIRKVIDDQLEQSRFCRAIARSSPNRRFSRALSIIANRNYSVAKNLASALIVFSGSYFFPGADRASPAAPYFRQGLRSAWKNEVSLTTRCTGASEKTEDVPIVKALIAAARGHAENAVNLRHLFTQFSEGQQSDWPG